MKKYILAAFLGMVIATPISAAEWGIGFSTQSDDQTIYFPIKVEDKLRIEPFFREKQITQNRTEYYLNNRRTRKTTWKFFDVGVGIFGIANIKEKSQLYYGVRISYQETEVRYRSEWDNSKSKVTGYMFSPTIGFEYMLTDNILIGGEAEWVFRDMLASNIDSSDDFERTDIQRSETNKRFILRYIF